MSASLHSVVQETAQGLGFDVVEIERTQGGLVRVSIEWAWSPEQGWSRALTVEDCERLSRQLQYVLEVEGLEYRRLEVASPGVDRLMRHEADLERFQGQVVDLSLKEAVGAAVAAGVVAGNRKHFRGVLEKTEQGWQVLWTDAPPPKPGVRVSAKRKPDTYHALGFVWSETKQIRLAPILNFKGRG